jgi:hypothetical protein
MIIGNGRGIVTHALRNRDYANARLFVSDHEAMAALSEALDAAFEELRHTGRPEVCAEIGTRIIAAIRLGG